MKCNWCKDGCKEEDLKVYASRLATHSYSVSRTAEPQVIELDWQEELLWDKKISLAACSKCGHFANVTVDWEGRLLTCVWHKN